MQILKSAWAECRGDSKYIICFFGVSILKLIAVLFSNFLVLWLTSFADEGLITEARSKELYQRLILTSVAFSILLAPLFGSISDRLPSRIVIPVAFTIRGICGYSFLFMDNPESLFSIVFIVVLIVSTLLEGISLEVLFLRGLPNQIRGTMIGVYSFFGHIGILLFLLVGGQMFDKIGKNSPFVFLAIMDTIVVLVALIMVCMGKLKSG